MAALDPAEVLARNARAAARMATQVGPERARKVLERAEKDLKSRLAQAVAGPGEGSFTHAQLQSTLAQVRATLRTVAQPGLRAAVVDTGTEAAEAAGGGAVEYLQAADGAFRGVGAQPLALDEAAMLDASVDGAQGSILRRLATGPGPEKVGVLDRYGMNVIGNFEQELQAGLLSRLSLDGVRDRLIAKSPFLQGAPASWAERIARTETMGAYNRANYEANKEADEQLGDVVKILVATFDDRTGSDSIACHGQIRRPEEPFETWFGAMQYPPNRPNDREIVVTHRIAWVIPPAFKWRDRGEVVARWRTEGRKGKPPGPLLMTTVDLSEFGSEG